MKMPVFILLASVMGKAFAANVAWNLVENWAEQAYGAPTPQVQLNYVASMGLMVDFGFEAIPNGSRFSVEHLGHAVNAAENLVVANKGDLIDESTTRHLPSDAYFLHAYIDDQEYGGTHQLQIEPDSDFYIMFASSDEGCMTTPRYMYGWVNIGVDSFGNLSLLGSAIDLDGGPMVVGGGSAIPEPSGTLLILLGGAVLVMRRSGAIRRRPTKRT